MSGFDLQEIALIGTALRRSQTAIGLQRQNASAQREIASLQREMLSLEQKRRQEEADRRQIEEQRLSAVIQTRKEMLAVETFFTELQENFNASNEAIVALAFCQGLVHTFADRLEDLSDIKFCRDLQQRIVAYISAMIASNAITADPSELVKETLRALREILTNVKECIRERLFIHPQYQTEALNLRSEIERHNKGVETKWTEFEGKLRDLKAQFARIGCPLALDEQGNFDQDEYELYSQRCVANENVKGLETGLKLIERRCELDNICESIRQQVTVASGYEQENVKRYTFNSLCSQLDSVRKQLFSRFDVNSVDISAVYKSREYVKHLRDSLDVDLQAIANQLPSLCASGSGQTLNMLLARCADIYGYINESDNILLALSLYDAPFLKGEAYSDTVSELDDICSFLKVLIVEHDQQCTLLLQINDLVTHGNAISAQKALDSIVRKFVDIPYRDWEQTVKHCLRPIREAQSLLEKVKHSSSLIGKIGTFGLGRRHLREKYADIVKTAGELSDCEVKSEVHRILSQIDISKL